MRCDSLESSVKFSVVNQVVKNLKYFSSSRNHDCSSRGVVVVCATDGMKSSTPKSKYKPEASNGLTSGASAE